MPRQHLPRPLCRRRSPQPQAQNTHLSSSWQYSSQSQQPTNAIRGRPLESSQFPDDYTDTQAERDPVSLLDEVSNARRSEVDSDADEDERPRKRM